MFEFMLVFFDVYSDVFFEVYECEIVWFEVFKE